MKYQVGDLVLDPNEQLGYITDVFEHQDMIHIVWFYAPNRTQRTSFSFFNICYKVISHA